MPPVAADLLSRKLTLSDGPEVRGLRVLIRADLNVPLSKTGAITNTKRIDETLPTIRRVLDGGARVVILASHLGRPDGRVVPEMSLSPVAASLSEKLGLDVVFLPETASSLDDPAILARLAAAPPGSVFLLENLRFHPEEEGIGRSTPESVAGFCARLSALCDVYINDAFGTAHRPHASIVGVAVPIRAAGLLMERELSYLGAVLERPKRPVLAILGGAKVSDKVNIVMNLIGLIDTLAIGGAMAYAFARFHPDCASPAAFAIGESYCDAAAEPAIASIIARAAERGVPIILPVDHVVARAADAADVRTVANDGPDGGVPPGYAAGDIGPQTADAICQAVRAANTVFWNGPLGRFEDAAYEGGTQKVMAFVAEETEAGRLVSVIGGGDTAAAASKFRLQRGFSHVSTGGGATLELLEGRVLPGIAALTDRASIS